jgi:hypothetical protein
MAWLITILLKWIFFPVFVLAYWLVAIKGGNALVRWLVPSQKVREFLTKDRYF